MRISQNLNQALSDLLAEDPDLYVLGEDIADPYGGPAHEYELTAGLLDQLTGDLVDLCWGLSPYG